MNEKVALEVAAAASYSGLRSLCVMKQVGMNVASDFLLPLAQYGTRGAMVLVSCEDPGALSSTNEVDSRQYARMMELPMLEPGDLEEARTITRWAFELSEELKTVVMVRSVTRMSHASGSVTLGECPPVHARRRPSVSGAPSSARWRVRLRTSRPRQSPCAAAIRESSKKRPRFRDSPFQHLYRPGRTGASRITTSACNLYCREAIHLLGLSGRVGLLKLATTWPVPTGASKKTP